jgi:tetratricopeptide (TPR) repeat protein
MFNNKLRLVFIAVCAILAVYHAYMGDFLVSGVLVLSGAIFTMAYFNSQSIWMVLMKLKRGKYKQAENILRKLKLENLTGKKIGYFHLAQGLIAFNKDEVTTAEASFKEAMNNGLTSTNDEVLIRLNLANIYLRQNNKQEASREIEKVKKLNFSSSFEKEIKKVEDALIRG